MDDATQKLVERVRAYLDAREWVVPEIGVERFDIIHDIDLGSRGHSRLRASDVRSLADALEAAQRPPISPEVREEMFRLLYDASGSQFMRSNERHSMVTEQRDAILARFSAPSRPPVGPEVRDAIRAVVGEQLTKAGLDLNGAPYSDDGETQWPLALELRDRMTAAILARFSVPSRTPVSPEVRDELIEEVAEALADDWNPSRDPVLSAMFRDYAATAIDAIARFSVPSQPVYDEERIAEVIARALTGFDLHMQAGVPSHTHVGRYEAVQLSREAAAALVAAIQNGELT